MVLQPQRVLGIGLQQALDLVGHRGEQPGEVHFDADVGLLDVDLGGGVLAQRGDPQVRDVADPGHVGAADLVDVFALHQLEAVADPPLGLGDAEFVREGHDDGSGHGALMPE